MNPALSSVLDNFTQQQTTLTVDEVLLFIVVFFYVPVEMPLCIITIKSCLLNNKGPGGL